MNPLAGRTALVTGGSRGIGAATARKLAELGADLVITYRDNAEAARKVVAECGGVAKRFDITDPVDGLADEVDIVVSNATSAGLFTPLIDLTAEQLTGTIATDVTALHRLVTRFVPGMLARGYGRVIVIGSIHAYGPNAPHMTANGVSKAALEHYVTYAVDELTGPGVTINTVHPGHIATDMSSHMSAVAKAAIKRLTPSGRTGVPDDVAAVVAALSLPDMGFVNGAVIPVAGGLNTAVAIDRVLESR
jgi:3-oxoacyl-[acyl-carrier protein] reductase